MSSLANLGPADVLAEGKNLIDGVWVDASNGDSFEVRSPSNPAIIVGTAPLATTDDADAAADAAAAAGAAWGATPIAGRGAILERAAAIIERDADRIATLMSREMGKPLREARGETLRAAAILRFFGGEGHRATGLRWQQATGAPVYTVRRPLGTVALITPWNFPLAIPTWKLAPALVYGNTVVMKLAQQSPLTGLELARALQAAGLPAGVLNVLVGSGARIGPKLVANPRIAAISFTGSEAVGNDLRSGGTAAGKRVQLELGGQNPLIVMDDADLDRAAHAAFAGAFWSAGQKCTATRRILVHEKVRDQFTQALLDRVASAALGDAEDPATEIGPVVSCGAMSDVLDGIGRGRAEAELLVGGARAERSGWFVEPTVFTGASPDAYVSSEEIFGPVTTISTFSDLDEAILRANGVRFGLSAGIFTGKLAVAHAFVERAQAGMVHINSQTAGAEVHVPFGGIKSFELGPARAGQCGR